MNNKNNNKNKSNNNKNKTKINNKNNKNKIRGKRRFRRKIIPAANIKNMNRDFKILYQDGNTVKVTGRDLVYKIPNDILDQDASGVITIIPANPCYWLGTRIAALAQGYQNYRPLNMKFTYIPQCAVTQQGNVIAGTLWNQAPSNENLQQSLRTSNGGQLSQCYKGFTSIVRLKSNLQYNLYRTAGQFDQEANPFIYMALAVGCKNGEQQIIPGYFYVTWSFLLKNPIGNTNVFYNSGIIRYSQAAFNNSFENRTAVFLNPEDEEIPMGALLQMERDSEGGIGCYYNGSYYTMQDQDIIWYFANSTTQTASQTLYRGELPYTKTQEERDQQFLAQFYFTTSNTRPDYYLVSLLMEPMLITNQSGTSYYYIENIRDYEDLHGAGSFGPYLGDFKDFEDSYRPNENGGVRCYVKKEHVYVYNPDEPVNLRNKQMQQYLIKKKEQNKVQIIEPNTKKQQPFNNVDKESKIKAKLKDVNAKCKTHKVKSTKQKFHDEELDAQFSASELFQ